MRCEVEKVDITPAQSRLSVVFALVPCLVALLGLRLGVALLPALVASWIVFPTLMIAWSWAYGRRGVTVVASEAGIAVDGEIVIPRTAVVSAVVEPGASGLGDPDLVRRILDGRGRSRRRASVVLRGRGGAERVMFVRSLEEGRAIVEALGFDPKSTIATFTGSSALVATRARLVLVSAFLAGLFVAFAWAALGATASPNGMWAAASAMGLTVVAAVWPSRITIGTDAAVIRWLRWTKIIDLGTIVGVVDVSTTTGIVQLALRDGRCVDVASQHARQVAERIEQARAARISRGDALDAPLPLARGERSVAEWLARLRQTERAFRDPALPADRLWSTVEDCAVHPSTRVAAAVALTSTLDAEGRSRLRVAAQSSATPKLRVALSAVVDGDDAALEDALRRLEADRPQ